MMKDSIKAGIILFILIVIGLVGYGLFSRAEIPHFTSQLYNIKNRWEPFPRKGREDFWLRAVLPRKSRPASMLYLETTADDFAIYQNGKRLDTAGWRGMTDGRTWGMIPLDTSASANALYLKLPEPADRDPGYVLRTQIGSETDLIAYLLNMGKESWILGIGLFFLGLLWLFAFLGHAKGRGDPYIHSGFVTMAAGWWLLSQSRFMQLAFVATDFGRDTGLMALYFLPLGVLIIVAERSAAKFGSLFSWMRRCWIGFVCVAFLLKISGRITATTLYEYFFLELFIYLVPILIVLVDTARKGHKRIGWNFTGISVWMAGSACEIGRIQLGLPVPAALIHWATALGCAAIMVELGLRLNKKLTEMERFLQVIEMKNRQLETMGRKVRESYTQVERLRHLNKNLEKLASRDELTGAFNRLRFKEIVGDEMRKSLECGTRLFLIIFDIDNFKQINDTFGHKTGDTVLREIAGIVFQTIRKTDSFIRWGGEEFIILAGSRREEAGYEMAERLRQKIAAYRFEMVEHVTISLGVVECKPGENIDNWLGAADDALYRVKRSGRNRTEWERKKG